MNGKIGFELDGLEQTIQNLDFANRRVNDGSNAVLREGGEVLKTTIEVNTPVGSKPQPRASEHVTTSNVGTDSFGGKSIKVGYDGEVAWRMWFLERGTYSKGAPKGIKPMKIVENSMEQSQGDIEQVFINGIRSLLGG